MSPELNAFRHYKKNIDYYLSMIESLGFDDIKLIQMYDEIANKFGGSGAKLMELLQISYNRSIDRAFR
jgi:hypothetical protein